MSDTAMPEDRVDPVQQVQTWLCQYFDHVGTPALKAELDHATIFRITRTTFQQGKSLQDLQVIIVNLAREKRKPKGIGWLIVVVEGKLGRVA